MDVKIITIREASLTDLDGLALLFQKYLLFYKRKDSLENVRHFLRSRLTKGEAKVFLAFGAGNKKKPLAFVLLYPGFSSLSLGKIYILNDLFVEEQVRHTGIASKLIDASRDMAKANKALRLDLSTANDNKVAQRLYEGYGFIKDELFITYSYQL